MGPAMAAEQVEMMQAVAHGIGVALSGKDTKTKQATRRLVRRAYPEVRE